MLPGRDGQNRFGKSAKLPPGRQPIEDEDNTRTTISAGIGIPERGSRHSPALYRQMRRSPFSADSRSRATVLSPPTQQYAALGSPRNSDSSIAPVRIRLRNVVRPMRNIFFERDDFENMLGNAAKAETYRIWRETQLRNRKYQPPRSRTP